VECCLQEGGFGWDYTCVVGVSTALGCALVWGVTVRVWWEVVVFPLLLRAMWLELWVAVMGSAVFAIYAGCACALCIVCVCALVYVICFLSKLLLSGVREGWYR
jgi:hypothetical protein